MTRPLIHGNRGVVPASRILETVAETLTAIRAEDKLTWGDIGTAIGKSEDQAAKYADGSAVMDMPTFLRACNTWNGRFSNPVLALFDLHIAESAADTNGSVPHLLLGMTQLSACLQQAMLDQKITDEEVIDMHSYIEIAGALVDYLRKRHAEALERRAAERAR